MVFKYRGILEQPRPHEPIPGPLADDKAVAAWKERYVQAALERWRALYEAHGVEWGNERELLRRMAEAHVPGFRTRAKSGPREVWNATAKAELRIAVDDYNVSRVREGKSASVAHACRELAKRDPWKGMLRQKVAQTAPQRAAALKAHYDTADPRWVNVVRDARSWGALPEHIKSRFKAGLFAKNLSHTTSRRKKSS